MYTVLIEKQVDKYLSKLPKNDVDYFKKRFRELETNKTGYRVLDRFKD